MAEFAFAKTSGTVTRDRETNWPIADRSFPSNDIRKNCGAHFGSTFLTVSWQIQFKFISLMQNVGQTEYIMGDLKIPNKEKGANWFPWSLFRHPRILRQRIKQGYQ